MNRLTEADEHVAGGVRNTPRMNSSERDDEYVLLGHGFDTVQLSFQTRIPDALADVIAEAKGLATQSRKPEPVALGPGRVQGEVLRHGGGGGDAIFSTGELGEMWFFKLSQKGDKWGVTVKIRSLALLCHGLAKAMEHLWGRAKGMGLTVQGYSLGRIDYRFDVRTPITFALAENQFIRPNRTLVRPFETIARGHPRWEWNEDPDIRRLFRGTRIETLMAGKIGSGMQVVIYDKRAELLATRKLALLESYSLDPHDKSWGLYRAEVRYAGAVLKRRWNVRDFPALHANLQPMLHKALTRTRYVYHISDTAADNVENLHPLWQRVTEAISEASCEQPMQFAPERAEYLIREERERALKANVAGCLLSAAAMHTNDPTQLATVAHQIGYNALIRAIAIDPSKVERAIRREWQSVTEMDRK